MLLSLAIVLFGCTQTEESKSALGAFALIIASVLISIVAVVLNILTYTGIKYPRKTVCFIGILILSQIAISITGMNEGLIIVGLVVALIASVLIKEKSELNGKKKLVLHWIGILVAVISIISSILLISAIISNLNRCNGICTSAASSSAVALIIALIPAASGIIRIIMARKLKHNNKYSSRPWSVKFKK